MINKSLIVKMNIVDVVAMHAFQYKFVSYKLNTKYFETFMILSELKRIYLHITSL